MPRGLDENAVELIIGVVVMAIFVGGKLLSMLLKNLTGDEKGRGQAAGPQPPRGPAL